MAGEWWRRGLPAVLMCISLVAAGCAQTVKSGSGRVVMDYASRNHLEVTEQEVERSEGGISTVTVTWKNVAEEEFSARISTAFYGPDGGVLDGQEEHWLPYHFSPGKVQVYRCSSPEQGAAGYLIRVESAEWWPF